MPNIMRIDISENVNNKELDVLSAVPLSSGNPISYNNWTHFWNDVNNDIRTPGAVVKTYTINLIYINHSPGCVYYYDSQGRLRKVCS